MSTIDKVADIGIGKVGKNSHPLHPSSVHFPVAFLIAGSGLTLLGYAATRSPALVAPLTGLLQMTKAEVATSITKLGHISNVAGFATSFIALNSGIWEGYNIYRQKGFNMQDPVVSTTVYHAALNDVSVAAAGYNWWTMRNVAGFVPSTTNAAVAALIFAGIGVSGYLGGSLSYKYGVGVQRMGEAKDIRDAEVREIKASARKEL